MRKLSLLSIAVVFCFVIGCGDTPKPFSGPTLPYTPAPPKEKQKDPEVVIKTELGDITVRLFEDDAPNTVANFITLAESKYYDGSVFHRIIKDFMIQGGGPKGNPQGTPGYKIPDEARGNPHKHKRGALAMGLLGGGQGGRPQSNSAGSQFYIVTKDGAADHLNGFHTIFGEVISGMDVVDKLREVTVEGDKPKSAPKINAVEILSKRDTKYEVRGKIAENTPPKPAMSQQIKMNPRPPVKVTVPGTTPPAPAAQGTPATKVPETKAVPPPAVETKPAPAETKKP